MQIDAIRFITQHLVECNLYTADRCVRITMMKTDYKALIHDGFFIRDGKTPDSAGVLNTTKVYAVKPVDDYSLEIE